MRLSKQRKLIYKNIENGLDLPNLRLHEFNQTAYGRTSITPYKQQLSSRSANATCDAADRPRLLTSHSCSF